MSLPFDNDAEQALLGCLMQSQDAVRWASEWMTASDFHVPSHAHAFAAIDDLWHDGGRVDPVTVAARMRQKGTWVETTSSTLLSFVVNAPATSSLQRYGEIVQRHSLARQGMTLAMGAVEDLQDVTKDPAVIVESLRSNLGTIDSPIAVRDPGDLTLEQLRAKPIEDRSPWVVPGLMRRDWRAMLVGVEGSGKSIILRQIAVCAAHGMHPFAMSDMLGVRTLLVDLENPEDHVQEWVDRIATFCERHGRTVDGRMAIWHRSGGIDLRRRSDRAEFEDVLRRRRPDLVCLGPLYKAYHRTSQESDEQVASEVQDVLDDLRTRHGFGLVLEHHAPKSQGGVRDLLPFGSSLWLRWGELRLSLVPEHKGFPVMSMELKPFSGMRVENSWPHRLTRGRTVPWEGHWPSSEHVIAI